MLISVIVPVYKTEPYLRHCVDSILAQTFPDFELILIDDGSPDHAGTICDEYTARDSRVRVIHQDNGGLSAARNAGIDWVFANSDSQWLTFLDSDDWIHPRFLELLLRANEEYGAAVSVCGYRSTADRGAPFDAVPEDVIKVCTPEDFWCAKPVNATIACCKLYARRCFTTVRYPVGKLHEDEFTTYRILFAEKEISSVDAPLYYYYQNNAGIMRSEWSPKRMTALEFLPQQIAFFEENHFQKALQTTVRGYAIWCEQNIKTLERRERTDAEEFISLIRKRYRALLRRYHKLLPYRNNENHPFYECAFPRFVRIRRTIGKLLRKLKMRR